MLQAARDAAATELQACGYPRRRIVDAFAASGVDELPAAAWRLWTDLVGADVAAPDDGQLEALPESGAQHDRPAAGEPRLHGSRGHAFALGWGGCVAVGQSVPSSGSTSRRRWTPFSARGCTA